MILNHDMKLVWSFYIYEQYEYKTECTAGIKGATRQASADQPDQNRHPVVCCHLDGNLYGMKYFLDDPVVIPAEPDRHSR